MVHHTASQRCRAVVPPFHNRSRKRKAGVVMLGNSSPPNETAQQVNPEFRPRCVSLRRSQLTNTGLLAKRNAMFERRLGRANAGFCVFRWRDHRWDRRARSSGAKPDATFRADSLLRLHCKCAWIEFSLPILGLKSFSTPPTGKSSKPSLLKNSQSS